MYYFVGFGNPTASAGYQGWGAPAGPQVPAPWSSTYGAPTQQTGYGSYGAQFLNIFNCNHNNDDVTDSLN